MRNLATIREIRDIQPIEGADRIEVAMVDGWEVVVAKKDNFKIGDKIIYIEIDSQLPEREEFEFLRNRKFRVRTIKLKKQVSQGLVIPLTILPKKFHPREDSDGYSYYKLGDDVTEILGITKYDPEAEEEAKLLERTKRTKNLVIKFMLKFKWFRKIYKKEKRKSGYPEWIVKTDETRIQNLVRLFEEEKKLGTVFQVTEKLDGQSATYFLEKNGKKTNFGVCSRNMNLTNDPKHGGSYWTIARQCKIEEVLNYLLGEFTASKIVLQGENIGEGIQGNKYNIKGVDFYAFNLIIDGKKIDTSTMKGILRERNIKTVPILGTVTLKDTIADMVEYAKGDSVLLKRKREGVVLRNYDKNISFKIINADFLLEEKD